MKQVDLNKMLVGAGVNWSLIPQNLADQMEDYGIIDVENCKRFLANCLNETGGFTRFSENGYYTSADRLRQVFPSAFTTGKYKAEDYLKNPEKLLNLVYDDRKFNKGLGNVYDGDGYKFRGRGAIQVTGRANYSALSKRVEIDFVGIPDLLSTSYRFISALDFWKTHNLSSKKSLLEVRQVIAGNYSNSPFGYGEVSKWYLKLKV